MKKALAVLLSLLLPLCACAETLSAQPRSEGDEITAALYFRYLDTDMLAAETRKLTVAMDETREKALVRALIEGPSASHTDLSGLFPAGTEVLSAQAQEDVLFVTFSEELLNPYQDEPQNPLSRDPQEAILRRRLAMASLAATLTESGEYAGVQALVLQKSAATTSLRLPESYFLNGGEGLTGPILRDESLLLTPHSTAQAILIAWRQRDFSTMLRYIAKRGRAESAGEAAAVFVNSPALIEFTLSAGSVSLDGSAATLCADMTLLLIDGNTDEISSLPLALIREDGIWKMPWAQALRLTGADK